MLQGNWQTLPGNRVSKADDVDVLPGLRRTLLRGLNALAAAAVI